MPRIDPGTISMLLAWVTVACIGVNEEPKPVAMVLSVQGATKLRCMDLLRTGDEVRVPKPGGLRLVFLADGHKETLGPGVAVRITGSGAAPAEAVRREDTRISGGPLKGLRALAASARSGVSRIRDVEAPPLPASPIDGSIVLGSRPAFTWTPVRDVAEYEIRLFRGKTDRKESLRWSVRASGDHLDYPGDQPALDRGETYTWIVSTPRKDVVAKGSFAVATAEDARAFDPIQNWSKSPDTSDRLLAAMIFEARQVYDESNRLFEELAKELPAEPWVLLASARHFARRGLIGEALDREKKALSLARTSH
jgi:hypothetical protein